MRTFPKKKKKLDSFLSLVWRKKVDGVVMHAEINNLYTLTIVYVSRHVTLHKKWSFPLKISSVNVTKSAISCGFGHIYWRNP